MNEDDHGILWADEIDLEDPEVDGASEPEAAEEVVPVVHEPTEGVVYTRGPNGRLVTL